MAGRKNDYKSPEKLRAELDVSTERGDEAPTPRPGPPDLSREACACGEFGPWGDGTAFYCARHVPPEIQFAGQFFAEMME